MNHFPYDEIRISRLHVYAYHGVFPEEKKQGQDFYVSALLKLDLHRAGVTDDLKEGVSYARVCDLIVGSMEEEPLNLIEAVADRLCQRILKTYDKVMQCEITVSKPHAPVQAEVEDISVTISRSRETVFIAYGSNMGDKEEYIEDAIAAIRENKMIRYIKSSHNYVTEPYGVVDQPPFLNGVLMCETIYTPSELLDYLHELEAAAGRERLVHWGPRTLDLDILFFGDQVINTEKLTIPHADMANRKFVLEPLCEIAPYLYHPLRGVTVQELYINLLRQ